MSARWMQYALLYVRWGTGEIRVRGLLLPSGQCDRAGRICTSKHDLNLDCDQYEETQAGSTPCVRVSVTMLLDHETVLLTYTLPPPTHLR